MPKKFTDFQLKQTLTDNDFFVGINSDERSEFKTNVFSLSTYVFSNVYVSSNWDSVYSLVKDASADWDSSYTTVKDTSGNWDSAYTTVNSNSATTWNYQGTDLKNLSSGWVGGNDAYSNLVSNSAAYLSAVDLSFLSVSANWDSAYSTVNSNSATTWNYQGTDIKSLTGDWDGGNSAYTNLVSNSAAYLSAVDLSFLSVSGNWDSVYSTYNANSADYTTTNYVNNNFLPLSGGTVTGITRFNNNVTIFGNLTSTGTQTFANTVFSTTSSLSVVHIGEGPALWVGNIGTGDIASFYDLDQNVEVLHVGGNNGSFPNVGIKTSAPNKDLTVSGEISASNTIWDANGNSNQWNSTYSNQTNYLPLSGGTMTGKLIAAADATISKLNIGNALSGLSSPATTVDGDIWISTSNRLSYKSNGNFYSPASISIANSFTSTQIIDVTSTNTALRVTQKGSGEALRVEDDPTPDSTAFIVGTGGNVGIGLNSLSGINTKLTVVGNISATGSYYGDGSNLTGIVAGDTVATTLVRNNSANWDSVYNSVNSASSTYVRTEETNTIGLSAINKIVAVSALPVTPDPSTLYIVIL
jgi:hypothetical protein